MSKLTVAEPFYYDHAIRVVGDPIEVESRIDRKDMIERGLITEGTADAELEGAEKAEPVPANKMEADPANKVERVSRRKAEG